MNLKYAYAFEKFSDAMSSMATSRDPLPKRLSRVRVHAFAALAEGQVPPSVKARFLAFCEAMASKDPGSGDDGQIAATVRSMSWHTADRLANDLVEMFFDICRAYYESDEGS
jgi:hypothetical protein